MVEALRVDHTQLPDQSFCEHCGMVQNSKNSSNKKGGSDHKKMVNKSENISLPARVSAVASRTFDRSGNSAYTEITTPDDSHMRYSNHHVPSTTRMNTPNDDIV